jgi:hypothetical protein
LTRSVFERRNKYLKLGFEPIPCQGKAPRHTRWTTMRVDERAISKWENEFPEARNTGIRAKNAPAVDLDIYDDEVANRLEELLREVVSQPALRRRVGLPPKRLVPFRADAPFPKLAMEFRAPGDDQTKHKIEVLCDGQQWIAEGIHPDTGRPYTWQGGGLIDTPRAQLPLLDGATARKFMDAARALLLAAGWTEVGNSGAKKTNGKTQANDNGESAWGFAEETRLRSALSSIPADEVKLSEALGESAHEVWVKIGRAIERLGWDERGYAVWRDWSSQNQQKYDEDGLRTQWACFARTRDTRENPVTVATAYHYARKCGWRDRNSGDGKQTKAKPTPDEKKKRAQAEVLAEHAKAAALFHTPAGESYADIPVGGHRETHRVRSRAFRGWLRKKCYEATGTPPHGEALATAVDLVDAQAQFDGPMREVHVRVTAYGNKIYLDLADKDWGVIEIDAFGWHPIENPPVRFRRAGGMLPLPVPESGGELDDLRGLLNVSSNNDCVLMVAWLLAALRGKGPYPVLGIAGEPGTAKSTCCALLRALVDPNAAPLRAMPRDDRDLFIAASNAHVVALDNVSGLQPWLSDTLCRLATGGGFATRRLHTDDEETLFSGQRPIVANGVEDIIGRSDLADRSILVMLDPITEANRRDEKDLWARFYTMRPKIVGALLDAVAHGLHHLPTTVLARKPRMADFALWATACEGALWEAGSFAAAYAGNREASTASAIEADLAATAIVTMMENRHEWSGTAQSLLETTRWLGQ